MLTLIAYEPDPRKRLIWAAYHKGTCVAFCEGQRSYWGLNNIEYTTNRWREKGYKVFLVPVEKALADCLVRVVA